MPPFRSGNLAGVLIPAVLGAVAFMVVTSGAILAPWNISWLTHGSIRITDRGAHLLALRVPPAATVGHFRRIVLRAGDSDGMTEGDAQELQIDLDRLEVKAAEP
jgi:hypothetical protein